MKTFSNVILTVLLSIKFTAAQTTYYIDDVTCGGVLRDTFTKAIDQSILYAQNTIELMNDNDPDMMAVYDLIFKDRTNLNAVIQRFSMIANGVVAPGARSNAEGRPIAFETTFYCDSQPRLVEVSSLEDDPEVMLDTYNFVDLELKDILDCVGLGVSTNADRDMAFTYNIEDFPNTENSCLTQICPPFFDWIRANSKWELKTQFVNQVVADKTACNDQSFFTPNPKANTQIDCVGQTLARVLLHEVTHCRWSGYDPRNPNNDISTAGATDDPDQTYGWVKVLALDATDAVRNADAYSFMGLAAWLIEIGRVTVNSDGVLVDL